MWPNSSSAWTTKGGGHGGVPTRAARVGCSRRAGASDNPVFSSGARHGRDTVVWWRERWPWRSTENKLSDDAARLGPLPVATKRGAMTRNLVDLVVKTRGLWWGCGEATTRSY